MSDLKSISRTANLEKLEEKYVPISLLSLMLESEAPVGLFENNCPQRGFCRGWGSINTQLVSFGPGRVPLGLHGGRAGMGLCKSLFCWRRRNLRRGLRLANRSLLDWKTYTSLPVTSDSVFFPSWSPVSLLLIFVSVRCPLVFLPPRPHLSHLFFSSVSIFYSRLFSFLHLRRPSGFLNSCVIFSLFHPRVLTLIRLFWGFFLSVCVLFSYFDTLTPIVCWNISSHHSL